MSLGNDLQDRNDQYLARLQPGTGTRFEKVVRIGTTNVWGRRYASVYAKIGFNDGRLSISGVIGPRPNGGAVSCGQIQSSLTPPDFHRFARGWGPELVEQFFETWERWHLNDMKAGSPAQEAYLRERRDSWEAVRHLPGSYYEWAKFLLKEAGLDPDPNYLVMLDEMQMPYSYGRRWLTEPVPQDVLDWLRALPDTDQKPAWV